MNECQYSLFSRETVDSQNRFTKKATNGLLDLFCLNSKFFVFYPSYLFIVSFRNPRNMSNWIDDDDILWTDRNSFYCPFLWRGWLLKKFEARWKQIIIWCRISGLNAKNWFKVVYWKIKGSFILYLFLYSLQSKIQSKLQSMNKTFPIEIEKFINKCTYFSFW